MQKKSNCHNSKMVELRIMFTKPSFPQNFFVEIEVIILIK